MLLYNMLKCTIELFDERNGIYFFSKVLVRITKNNALICVIKCHCIYAMLFKKINYLNKSLLVLVFNVIMYSIFYVSGYNNELSAIENFQ